MKENEVLARFMDAIAKEESDGWILMGRNAPVVGWYHGFDDMSYHKDWSWIMPVWYKFKDLQFENYTLWLRHDILCKAISEAILHFGPDPAVACKRLSEAIEWYNTKNK